MIKKEEGMNQHDEKKNLRKIPLLNFAIRDAGSHKIVTILW